VRGFTLVESLVVLVLLVIAVAIAMSLVQERLQTARIRVSAQQFAVHLRSARFAAVSQRSPADVIVSADPENTYRFTDVRGKDHIIRLPAGVRIVSSSSPIRFQANGAVSGGASTVMEVELPGDRLERWEIDTAALGVPRLSHERIGL
jgi:prepilin-type N-terminal cleavage/methylation domain-containing protein